jgi:hypothetical protein
MKGLVAVGEIPPAANLVAECSIAVLKSAYDHTFAGAWVEAVGAPDGQATLAAAGFLPGGESVSRGDSR